MPTSLALLLLIARVQIGPPGFGLVMLPIAGVFWLASKAVSWVDDKSRLKQLAGKVGLAGIGLTVLYLMYKFLEALAG